MTGLNEIERPWAAMPPHEIAGIMRSYSGRWWIAGGWSLDLFLGHPTREHEDTDVLVLQPDLGHIHRLLPGWTIMAAEPPGTLRPWREGEPLPPDIRDIWCRPAGSGRWWFEFMVMRTDADRWIFPRDNRITGRIADLDDVRDGIPLIAPELQLLYKSRVPHREKDLRDLQRMIPRLDRHRAAWLRERVGMLYPDSPALPMLGHPG
jgi:hypothetical protein